ncbi:hypothetical protein QTP88_027960 [Uroleucon formosanum]
MFGTSNASWRMCTISFCMTIFLTIKTLYYVASFIWFFNFYLEKYTSREIPSDSTLPKTCVNDICEETMKNIREQIKGNKIWVSIDETTDSEGKYVANVIIGTLNTDAPGKTYLLTTEVLEKANNSTIVKLFDHSMFVLWPNGIRHDDVLLFVTDAAPYMVKAGQTL